MQRLSFSRLRAYLAADLFRYEGRVSAKAFVKHFLFTPGFNYTVWLRACVWAKSGGAAKLFYPLLKWRLLHSRYKYGIAIAERTVIGPGLFINRFGGIYVHHDVVIGCNVNITHGTMLGYMNRGPREGSPIIGDEVFFGSGAKAIGKVHIGNRAAIGVNAVVTKDVPDNGVAVGLPAKVIGNDGSDGYINKMASPAMIERTGWSAFRPQMERQAGGDHRDMAPV
jgi:serine O-acetyltransferase